MKIIWYATEDNENIIGRPHNTIIPDNELLECKPEDRNELIENYILDEIADMISYKIVDYSKQYNREEK